MSLIITFMFEPAKLHMNWARASGAMNARGSLTQLAVPPPPADIVLIPPPVGIAAIALTIALTIVLAVVVSHGRA
jgi:hypothetical protein